MTVVTWRRLQLHRWSRNRSCWTCQHAHRSWLKNLCHSWRQEITHSWWNRIRPTSRCRSDTVTEQLRRRWQHIAHTVRLHRRVRSQGWKCKQTWHQCLCCYDWLCHTVCTNWSCSCITSQGKWIICWLHSVALHYISIKVHTLQWLRTDKQITDYTCTVNVLWLGILHDKIWISIPFTLLIIHITTTVPYAMTAGCTVSHII